MADSNVDLEAEFHQRKAELEAALAYTGGTHTLADVWRLIEAGTLQLWLADHSVLVTEVLAFPQCRVLHFFLGAGRMGELQALYPAALAWGKEQGCTKASLTGRPGWIRSFLVREGWTATHIAMSKDL